MKIAFFNRSFHPDVEAVGLLLTELCEELTKRYNISTTVVAGLPYYSENSQYHKKFPFAREHYQGTKILRVWSLSLDKSKTFCRFANYVSFTILSVLAGFRLGKQDIIIAHTNPPTVPIVAFLFAKLYRAKFIYWCKEIFPETANLLKDYHNRHMDNILNRVNRFLFKRADKIVVIGEMMKKRLVEEKGAPEEKITIIRDWARCDRIYPVKESNPFKLKYGLDGKLVIMHSGNIGLAQEVETVVEVAKAFNDRKDIVFLIVGDGARKKELQKKAESYGLTNVTFLPFQPTETLKFSLSAADIHIVSLKKGFSGYLVPSKIYNILATGCALIAAGDAECEMVDMVQKYECGFTCRPGDIEAIVSFIEKCYNNRSFLKRISENARNTALHYDFEKPLDTAHKLFLELTQQG